MLSTKTKPDGPCDTDGPCDIDKVYMIHFKLSGKPQ